MISHLVLMSLKQPSDAPFVAAQVHTMAGRVPGLLSIAGGSSVVELPSTWDLGFVMKFADKASVGSYQSHPFHRDVASKIKDLIQEMATCDLLAADETLPDIAASV